MSAGEKPLTDEIKTAPAVNDPAAVQRLAERLGAEFHAIQGPAKELIIGTASASPYLRRIMWQSPDLLRETLETPWRAGVARAMEEAAAAVSAEGRDARLRALRLAKTRAAFVIALADIAGAADVMEAATALSSFADAAVASALSIAAEDAGLAGADGIAAIAMGKLGARELNFSSDIDLVMIFDPPRMTGVDPAEARHLAVRASKGMVAMLQSQTADGYVFRTDLRLRPDPGVSALAVSLQSAEAYYEAFGQNWERMAYIKARPCAGDPDLGADFIASMRPYVWRKYLDFAAIEDVHAVKRQIHAVKGHAQIDFEGHNIKLGRGGIREIEFYVQTQQLILGGKNERLRASATLDGLKALARAGHISNRAEAALEERYRYLRHVEHRMQMINDEQNHCVPKSPPDIERLALFVGAPDAAAFRADLIETLTDVHNHYADLFAPIADEPDEVVAGTLVFTGVDDHPGTLETLQSLGFERTPEISATIRRWHTGAIRATRTERARIILTKLVPPLLQGLSRASRPDDAFFAFERFVGQLPAGVQVFSLLLNNIEIFDTLFRILTISPRLGRELSERVNFIEQLLDNEWRAAPPEPGAYRELLREAAPADDEYEIVLNAVRRWAGEQRFQLAAQLATDILPAHEAGRRFSAIAQAAIRHLDPVVRREMRRMHGDIEGDLCILGLGRLGAEEMTASSDIDLVFVYDAPPDAVSDGERALSAPEYFTRLVRRLVTALSAPTEEGALYPVDMQLRPSGGAGPWAVSMPAFRRYYETDAWTWEIMALTRARAISKPSPLARDLDDELARILRRRRDPALVGADISDMRKRLLTNKPARGPWDVKYAVGGQTELTFALQYLALTKGDSAGRQPNRMIEAIDWCAGHELLPLRDIALFARAHRVFESVLQVSRATAGDYLDPVSAGETLRRRMAACCGEEDLESAEAVLVSLEADIASAFRRLVRIDEPRPGAAIEADLDSLTSGRA